MLPVLFGKFTTTASVSRTQVCLAVSHPGGWITRCAVADLLTSVQHSAKLIQRGVGKHSAVYHFPHQGLLSSLTEDVQRF